MTRHEHTRSYPKPKVPDRYILQTLVVTLPISDESLEKLHLHFPNIHYRPDGQLERKAMEEGEVWFTGFTAFPASVGAIEDIPKARVLQLTSAGANQVLKDKVLNTKKAQEQLAVCNASGIHVFSIPQYIVSQVINLFMYHQIQFDVLRSEAKWPSREDLYKKVHPDEKQAGTGIGSRSLYGKTAGFLGYGHIGREAARLLKAFNVTIIAANSSGTKKADEGYIVPGTGDIDGSLPSDWYSTTDPHSFKKFLGRCDILIASLPSTPATTHLLKAEHLAALPDGAVFVNVGRGDLVSSDILLEALNTKGGLDSIALDVTDPEPLPDNHPFFTHPRIIITPHTSGNVLGYLDKAVDLLIANVERIRSGGEPFNKVDWNKGY